METGFICRVEEKHTLVMSVTVADRLARRLVVPHRAFVLGEVNLVEQRNHELGLVSEVPAFV